MRAILIRHSAVITKPGSRCSCSDNLVCSNGCRFTNILKWIVTYEFLSIEITWKCTIWNLSCWTGINIYLTCSICHIYSPIENNSWSEVWHYWRHILLIGRSSLGMGAMRISVYRFLFCIVSGIGVAARTCERVYCNEWVDYFIQLPKCIKTLNKN